MLPAEIKMISAGSTATSTIALLTTSSKTAVFRTAVKLCYIGALSAVAKLLFSSPHDLPSVCAAQVRIIEAGDAYRARMGTG